MRVVNAKKLWHCRLGAFSEQKWVWAWVLTFNVFQRPSWSRQNSIWTASLRLKWGPKTVLQSVFFRVPTSRHDYWNKCIPPRRNHVSACWRDLKIGRFKVPNSIKNRYFFDILLGIDFCWSSDPKWRFRESKTEATCQQKSNSRRFAWSVEKCIAQAVLWKSRRLGPEASPGGLGGLLSTTY